MTFACFAWQFAAGIHLLKLQRTICKFPKCALVCELHMAFQVPYTYDYIMKLCRQQAEVIQNHKNENVHDIGEGET
jgi:hypothetical protein